METKSTILYPNNENIKVPVILEIADAKGYILEKHQFEYTYKNDNFMRDMFFLQIGEYSYYISADGSKIEKVN